MRHIFTVLMLVTTVLYGGINYYDAAGTKYEVSIDKDGIKKTSYTPALQRETSRVSASFEIGAFKPVAGEYGFKCYDMNRTLGFLKTIPAADFKDGDVIEVDGLKWKKEGDWVPHANPPEPILEKGEDVGKHLFEYGKWINDHPHLGYPPLPIDPIEFSRNVVVK